LQRAPTFLHDAAKRSLDKIKRILLVMDIEVTLAGHFEQGAGHLGVIARGCSVVEESGKAALALVPARLTASLESLDLLGQLGSNGEGVGLLGHRKLRWPASSLRKRSAGGNESVPGRILDVEAVIVPDVTRCSTGSGYSDVIIGV
jgi:hypothetical protein